MERTFDAPAGAVFDAWTTPEAMRRWWHAGVPDRDTPVAEVGLRVGGRRLRVVMRRPSGEEPGIGHYTGVRPPARLAFTWTWDDDPPGKSSLVELDF